MKRTLKLEALHHGGYTVIRRIYNGAVRQRIRKRISIFRRTGVLPLPQMLMLEPTQRCNLRCRMCYQNRDALQSRGSEMGLERLKELIDGLPFLKKVTLIGGEVFMRRDIFELIEHVNENRDIVICTNGTLLDRPAVERLKQFRRIYTFCISIDGPRTIHDQIRGMEGAFEKTESAIRALKADFPITVNCVIQNENLEALPQLVDMCAQWSVKKLKLELERIYRGPAPCDEAEPPHRLPQIDSGAAAGRNRSYSADRLAVILSECRRRSRAAGIFLAFDPPFLPTYLDGCYRGSVRRHKRFLCQSFLTATLDGAGNLIHCFVLRKSFGNLNQTAFENAWNSETARRFRQRLLDENMTEWCENCPYLIMLN